MVGEAALITVTWEISSDSGALQGTGGASLAGVCNQEEDSISCPDTASTETEDLAGSKMPSNINLLPPPEADQSANSGVTFTWEQRAARHGPRCQRKPLGDQRWCFLKPRGRS